MNTLPKIENFTSSNGNKVANQFRIVTDEGTLFKSYDTNIALIREDGEVILDKDKWDFSNTTGVYRNQFLNESKKETQRNIDSGVYKLANLN